MNACELTDRGILLLVDYLKHVHLPLQSLSASNNPGIKDTGGLVLIETVDAKDSPVVALDLEGTGMNRHDPTDRAAGSDAGWKLNCHELWSDF